MATKKATKQQKPAERDFDEETGEVTGTVTNSDGADGWHEEASTASTRWYVPTEEASTEVTVKVQERQERSTKYGARGFYMCQVVGSGQADVKGPFEEGMPLIIWESAGLRDLNRFVGDVVRVVPNGRSGRTRAYRLFRRSGRNQG